MSTKSTTHKTFTTTTKQTKSHLDEMLGFGECDTKIPTPSSQLSAQDCRRLAKIMEEIQSISDRIDRLNRIY